MFVGDEIDSEAVSGMTPRTKTRLRSLRPRLGGSEKDEDSKNFEAIAAMHHNSQLNGYRNL